MSEQNKVELVAWRVTGPYENSAFTSKTSAEAYCRGLDEGFGEIAYNVEPLYTSQVNMQALRELMMVVAEEAIVWRSEPLSAKTIVDRILAERKG